MPLISLLIWLLIIGLVIYLIFWVMSYLGVPEPIRKVVTVVVVVIAILWIVGNFLPGVGHWPVLR